MGTEPKTKAEIMKKIADKRARIAQLQAQKTYPNTSKYAKYQISQHIADLRGDIAKLKAKVHDAHVIV